MNYFESSKGDIIDNRNLSEARLKLPFKEKVNVGDYWRIRSNAKFFRITQKYFSGSYVDWLGNNPPVGIQKPTEPLSVDELYEIGYPVFMYPTEIIGQKINEWENSPMNNSLDEGWGAFYDSSPPTFEWNPDAAINFPYYLNEGGFFEIQVLDDSDLTESEAYTLAKNAGFVLDKYGTILGFNGVNYVQTNNPGLRFDTKFLNEARLKLPIKQNRVEITDDNTNGTWEKREYDYNNNLIYFENSDGYWNKYVFNSNNKLIYFENSDGYWKKYEYDSNGNKIYYEDSTGYWAKRVYDLNNNEIYYVNSDGNVVDNRNLSEARLKLPYKEYISVPKTGDIDLFGTDIKSISGVRDLHNVTDLSGDLNAARSYLEDLGELRNITGTLILSHSNVTSLNKLRTCGCVWVNESNIENLGQLSFCKCLKIEQTPNLKTLGSIFNGTSGYISAKGKTDFSFGSCSSVGGDLYLQDTRNIDLGELKYVGKNVYLQGSDLTSADFNNIEVGGEIFEDNEQLSEARLNKQSYKIKISGNYPNGKWTKEKYNSKGFLVFIEKSDGYWVKFEYDSNNNEIYYETSDGYWVKYEYDTNNNLIYSEDSHGRWSKSEYDLYNNLIYYEDSVGIIRGNEQLSEARLRKSFKAAPKTEQDYDQVPNNVWDWDQEIFDMFKEDGYYDSGGHWYFAKISDTDYETTYDGVYMDVYGSFDDMMMRQNVIGSYKYDDELSDERNEATFTTDRGEERLYEGSINEARLKLPLKQKTECWIGIDSDIETSLHEYGFVMRQRRERDYPDEWFVLYRLDDNYFDTGWVRESDLDNLVRGEEWMDETDVTEFLDFYGMDSINWLDQKIVHKFYDLFGYYGPDNIMGSSNSTIDIDDANELLNEYSCTNLSEARLKLPIKQYPDWRYYEITFCNDDQAFDDDECYNTESYYFKVPGNIKYTSKSEFGSFNEGELVLRYLVSNGLITKSDINRFHIIREITDEEYNDEILNEARLKLPIKQNRVEITGDYPNGKWVKRTFNLNDKLISRETSDGYWSKFEYDSNGNEIYYKNSYGDWTKKEYDSNGNQIYFENNDGYWWKKEYDSNGNQIYFETSNGDIIDNRNLSEARLKLPIKQYNLKDRVFDFLDKNGQIFYSNFDDNSYFITIGDPIDNLGFTIEPENTEFHLRRDNENVISGRHRSGAYVRDGFIRTWGHIGAITELNKAVLEPNQYDGYEIKDIDLHAEINDYIVDWFLKNKSKFLTEAKLKKPVRDMSQVYMILAVDVEYNSDNKSEFIKLNRQVPEHNLNYILDELQEYNLADVHPYYEYERDDKYDELDDRRLVVRLIPKDQTSQPDIEKIKNVFERRAIEFMLENYERKN